MTTFSVTEVGSFKACRRSWWHGSLNGLGLTNWMPNKNLILGTLVHATMADWSVAWSKGERSAAYPVDRFKKHFDAAAIDIRSRYLRKTYPGEFLNSDGSPMTDEQRELVIDVANRLNPDRFPGMAEQEFAGLYGGPVDELGSAMIANYREFWGEPYPSHLYELVETEQTITVKVPGTIHRLEGTFDMLLQDQKGRYLIPDHKTYERKPSEHDLQQTDQFLRYQWLATQALSKRGAGGGEVLGTMYNGLWKRTTPPKGRTFDELFFREVILHDEEEIEEIGRFLPHEVREMDRVRRNPSLQFPNRAWSTCPGCAINDMCLTMSRGEDISDFMVDFTKRDRSPAWLVESREGAV